MVQFVEAKWEPEQLVGHLVATQHRLFGPDLSEAFVGLTMVLPLTRARARSHTERNTKKKNKIKHLTSILILNNYKHLLEAVAASTNRQRQHVSLGSALPDSWDCTKCSTPTGAGTLRFAHFRTVVRHFDYHKFDTNYHMWSVDLEPNVALDSTIDCLS